MYIFSLSSLLLLLLLLLYSYMFFEDNFYNDNNDNNDNNKAENLSRAIISQEKQILQWDFINQESEEKAALPG